MNMSIIYGLQFSNEEVYSDKHYLGNREHSWACTYAKWKGPKASLRTRDLGNVGVREVQTHILTLIILRFRLETYKARSNFLALRDAFLNLISILYIRSIYIIIPNLRRI